MLACEIFSRTSDRDREIENLREDREAILTIDAKESKEEAKPICCSWMGLGCARSWLLAARGLRRTRSG